jgi:hypothetical protein
MLLCGMNTQLVMAAGVVVSAVAALRSCASREARSFVGQKHNRSPWTVLGGMPPS